MLCSTKRKKLKMLQESPKSKGREMKELIAFPILLKIQVTPPCAYRHIHLIFLAASFFIDEIVNPKLKDLISATSYV